jgi:hypothetical protein
VTTRDLIDGKRRRLDGAALRAAPTDRKLDFDADSSRPPRDAVSSSLGRSDTALGRFLKAHKGRALSLPSPPPDASGATPVPRVSPPTAQAFACLRELQDFRNPLPPVPAGESLRRSFICHFGGLHGMDAAPPPSRRCGKQPRMAITRPWTLISCDFTRISWHTAGRTSSIRWG